MISASMLFSRMVAITPLTTGTAILVPNLSISAITICIARRVQYKQPVTNVVGVRS